MYESFKEVSNNTLDRSPRNLQMNFPKVRPTFESEIEKQAGIESKKRSIYTLSLSWENNMSVLTR